MLLTDDDGRTLAHLAMTSLEKPETSATPAELEALIDKPCPTCGSELFTSFGLMGGGYGPMVICDNLECGFFKKHDLGPDAE